MVKHLRSHNETLLRIPHYDVGIVSRRNCAFVFFKCRQSGRAAAHPPYQMFERIISPAQFRPHDGKTELQRGDAAPGSEKIAGVSTFHLWSLGRLVGNTLSNALLSNSPPHSLF